MLYESKRKSTDGLIDEILWYFTVEDIYKMHRWFAYINGLMWSHRLRHAGRMTSLAVNRGLDGKTPNHAQKSSFN